MSVENIHPVNNNTVKQSGDSESSQTDVGGSQRLSGKTEKAHARADIAAVIYELRQEHRDLDQAIAALSSGSGSDQVRIGRLKKRKLHLKDQIAYWESHQIPDLNA